MHPFYTHFSLHPFVYKLFLVLLQVLHDKCREVGIEEFVCKPFRVQDLQRVLMR